MAAYVYLIHFEKSLHHARHYTGYTSLENVTERYTRHKAGNGSRLLARLNQLGIDYHIVRVWICNNWREARDLERKLKKRKDSPGLCPICNSHAASFLYCPTATVQSTATEDGIPF